MFTLLIAAVSCFAQVRIHEVERFSGFEVQGVGITDSKGQYLTTCVRVRGVLPSDGIWSLKVLSVDSDDGLTVPLTQPMAGVSDVTTTSMGTTGFSPFKVGETPDRIRVRGELEHYQSVEETANFPTIHLVKQGGDGASRTGKAFRRWLVPEDDKSTATTSRGLVLRFKDIWKMGYGHSGVGYDDLSCLPVEVDPTTLSSGIAKELADCKATTVDRVDAYIKPDYVVHLYGRAPAEEYGEFNFVDSQFTPEVRLSLHVFRRIVGSPVYVFADFADFSGARIFLRSIRRGRIRRGLLVGRVR